MYNFQIDRKGYKKEEVETYINFLENEYKTKEKQQEETINKLQKEVTALNVKLTAYKNKENLISKALMDAMTRAKLIEENSKKIYELEIQKVRVLYNKYLALYNMFQNNETQPNLIDVGNVARSLKASVNKVLNSQYDRINATRSADAKMRDLLSKMNNVVAERNFNAENKNVKEEKEEQRITNIKPICQMNLTKEDDFEDLVDKFLESDEVEHNAYENELLKTETELTNGFNLKEAVNPTESLEDIMKAFNLDDEDI